MIIVTGGCGFIGSHVVKALEARGDHAVVVDLHPTWDVISPRCRPSAVVHLGAVTSTTETDAVKVLENNQLLSAKIWRFCRDNKAQLVYASSASVYGVGLRGFSEILPLDMNSPLPLYADSKRWFDNYALRQTETPPHWHGLRLFNVYGDGEEHKGAQASVVSKWLRGQPIELFEGSNEFRRDFVFIDDVVSVILWALDNPPPNGIYNVGTGRAASFTEAATAVIEATRARNLEPIIIPMPAGIAKHYQKRTQANLMKLRAAGYSAPFKDIFEGAAITAKRLK